MLASRFNERNRTGPRCGVDVGVHDGALCTEKIWYISIGLEDVGTSA
jgi:hypothetical protein